MSRMRRIALFARPPIPGRTKTRLSPALPSALAAAVSAALVEDSARAVATARADERSVWWAEPPGEASVAGLQAHLQAGHDLGERLTHTFGVLLRSDADRALVVGSDTPALEPAHLDHAFSLLDAHDVVLGPARDGGYWCIGLRKMTLELFRDIPWSTSGVLETTLARTRTAGLAVAPADTLDDLDTPADLARVVGELARARQSIGPALRSALSRMGLAPVKSASSVPAAPELEAGTPAAR
jgi:rSAM/selenodomain-associated transferase 1